MKDEERKQFINEYCRNVGNIKIKCDDCKFVEDCVDYGWDGCRKFTPAPSKPITNEDCIRDCKTQDELAKVLVGLCDRAIQSRFGGVNFTTDVELVKEWLQKPHEVDDEMES